jgi:hypothetical protein
MRILFCLPLFFTLLLGVSARHAAGQAPLKEAQEGATGPLVHLVLREVSEIALKHGERESSWSGVGLVEIGELQTRAGDFDGALKSLRGVCNYPAMTHLVEALARSGKKDHALVVARMLHLDWGRDQQARDLVQSRWVDHLIAKGTLQDANKAAEPIKSPNERRYALLRLALAYRKTGAAAQASDHFTQALASVADIESDSDRAKALWEIADAQRQAGCLDEAQATGAPASERGRQCQGPSGQGSGSARVRGPGRKTPEQGNPPISVYMVDKPSSR